MQRRQIQICIGKLTQICQLLGGGTKIAPKSANYRGQGSPRPLKKGEGSGVPPWVSNVVYRRLRDASEIFEAPRRGDYFRRKRHRKCLDFFLQKMDFFTEILSIF